MDLERYRERLPMVSKWIEKTLGEHASGAQIVASFGFKRLPQYYSHALLDRTKVVVVDRIPVPPLRSLGLPEFAAFETQPMGGITYLDTYFLQAGTERNESIHFHELVHVVQWQTIGPEKFLLTYAMGLALHGYRNSPLEAMAYDNQARFDKTATVYAVEPLVKSETLDLIKQEADWK
jgi:hypothetical protein